MFNRGADGCNGWTGAPGGARHATRQEMPMPPSPSPSPGDVAAATVWPLAYPLDARPARPHPVGDAAPDDEPGPSWTAERLRAFVRGAFPGERLIVLANREPVLHERTPGGGIAVRQPASGVVTALEPLTLACDGVWIAHGSGSADRDVVDARDGVAVTRDGGAYRLRRLWLSAEEERGYYAGFANDALWPLCHLAHVKPAFRRQDFETYQRVNRRFAEAVCDEADSLSPIVLVQDYHFAFVPQAIRQRLPRATTVVFWHIPWPNRHLFATCPWRTALLEGLLGSSVIGFQTATDVQNFLEAVQHCLEAHVDRETHTITYNGRRIVVGTYPIAIEWPAHLAAQAPPVADCRREIRRRLGVGEETWLAVGVDRLDYTKGLEEKLLGVEQLLERRPSLRGRFVLAQVAPTSRGELQSYRDAAVRVREAARRVNARFGDGVWRPVVLLEEAWSPAEVWTLLRAADACCVTSLHDGMNLVAKEFVAARDDGQGVLVLSTFAGAARELRDALLVNPYDAHDVADALERAIAMPAAEQRSRLARMREVVGHHNAYRWAAGMLKDARQQRLEDARAAWREPAVPAS
jgi:trehalose 6-phosphate synthase